MSISTLTDLVFDLMPDSAGDATLLTLLLILAMCLFATSFSITRLLSVFVIRVFSKASYVNFLGAVVVISLQVVFILYWLPIPNMVRQTIIGEIILNDALVDTTHALILAISSPKPFTLLFAWMNNPFLIDAENDTDTMFIMFHMSALLNLIPLITRIGITVMFMCSFGLQTIRKPIMEMWLGVIESEKPVFTVLGAGIGAIAGAVRAILINV
jgi:hypothetical protein